jgi:YD repeat-containing protein
MMKKRGISFLMACLMAVQPGLSVAAQSEENSVIRGADYTIRAHVDGTKTLTFYADLEASDYAGSSAAEDGREAGTERKAGMRKAGQSRTAVSSEDGQKNSGMTQGTGQTDETEALSLETSIEGEGEDAEVTLSYGDLGISFTAEIFEGREDAEPALEPVEKVLTMAAQEGLSEEKQGGQAPETGSDGTRDTDQEAGPDGETAPDQSADSDGKSDTNQAKDPDGETDLDQETSPGEDSEPDRETDEDGNIGTDKETDADGHNHTEKETDADGNNQTDRETDADSNNQTNRETDVNSNNETDRETGADNNNETDRETDADRNSDINAETNPDGNADNTNTEAEPDGIGNSDQTGEPGETAEPGGENGTEAESGWEAESETDGNTLGNTDAKIPEPEIRYEKKEDGIKEELILYGYCGGHRVDYAMQLTGLVPVQEGNGFGLLDEEGNRIFSISEPFLYDAAGDESREIAVNMEQVEGDTWRLSYVPSDAWLSDPARKWPVVLDPTIKTEKNTDIEDNYVTDGSGTHYDENKSRMLAGNKDGSDYTAFLRPAIPDSLKDIASHVVITKASVMLYVEDQSGSQDYEFYAVEETWKSSTITGKNQPKCASSPFYSGKLSTGKNTVNIKPLVSTWFNSLNQKENCGLAVKGSGKKGNYIELASSDQGDANVAKRVSFSITYEEIDTKAKTGLKASAQGNSANSGTGYVNLSWNSIPGAEGYYVGVYNGKAYEYFFVGNTTSWSTSGKGIWPTEEEIEKKRYKLHGDGKGAELPCIPAFTYANVAGGTHASDLSYQFTIVPANSLGQAIDPGTYKGVSAILPDRIAPNQPAAVTATPSGYSKGNTLSISWNGIRDYNSTSAGITDTLGDGRVQYSIDNTTSWQDTDQNVASGSYTFSTASLSDGEHTVYVRGRDAGGNTGGFTGAHFYIDRTGPAGQSLTVSPQGYTNEETVTLSWSGMSDLNAIAKTEYRIDGGAWTDTGSTAGSYAGFVLDIRHLSDGKHTLFLRGQDSLGNTGTEAYTEFLVDRTAPSAGEIHVVPEGWKNAEKATLTWEGAFDATSGIASMEYAVDGSWKSIGSTAGSGSVALDVKGLTDGEHTVSFRVKDRAGNGSETKEAVLYLDTTMPQALITAPADRAILEGVCEIKGLVEDDHLAGWKLTARDRNGKEKELASSDASIDTGAETEGNGNGESGEETGAKDASATESNNPSGERKKEAEVSGSLDLSGYPDGEHVTVVLTAWDEAGNEAEDAITVIRVDGSMNPFEATLALDVPERITKAQEQGSYSISGEQDRTYVYIDGELAEAVSGGNFLIDGVRYSENSTHTVSAVSVAEGSVRYSNGLGSQRLLEMRWEDGARKKESSGTSGAEAGSTGKDDAVPGGDAWVSETLYAARKMLALRLDVTDFVPGNSSICYEYTTDGGAVWNPVIPGEDAVFGEPAEQVQVRALFTRDQEDCPELYRMEIEGVLELSPQTFTVSLEKKPEVFYLTGPDHVTEALTGITYTGNTEASGSSGIRWYLDGTAVPFEHDVLDARYIPEEGSGVLSGVLLPDTEDGRVAMTGGSSRILLREDKGYATGIAESGDLFCDGPVCALRLLAAVRGGEGRFFFSTDRGMTWQEMQNGEYLLLTEMADTVRVRAELLEAASLAGWHLEGYSASGRSVSADLVSEPVQAVAADYGAFEKEKRYELKWQDTQRADSTMPYTETYRVYRDGEFIGETEEKIYTDKDYKEKASYAVSKVRTYQWGRSGTSTGGPEADTQSRYAVRESGQVSASHVVMQGDKKEAEKKDLEEYRQSDALSSLYGGNHTFVIGTQPPRDERLLSQELLGANKYCALGFEPINFNTGNFFLETRDYAKESTSGPGFDMLRTYNAQSSEEDGLFGPGWGSPYSQYLQMYADGSIGWRKADGALVLFEDVQEGYLCTGDGHEELKKGGDGFAVRTAEGTTYTFSQFGLLEKISEKGQDTQLLRDGRGVLRKVRLAGGVEIEAETDEKGHLIKLTQPGGAQTAYGYDENGRLVQVTDVLGNTVRYVYDRKGRMCEWYDKAGNRQVYNEYDEEDRVVYQECCDKVRL